MALSTAAVRAAAYELNDRFSVGGVVAGAIQCQEVSEGSGRRDTCASALPVQPELHFRPTQADELFLKLGFAAANGLNGRSPFVVAPWAADLQDDVENINGASRDHILTAWYKHSFEVADGHTLGATLGIIDATDYLDKNAYANDEYTQFMNPALTNGPNVFLPSYDLGVALESNTHPWSLRGVLMAVAHNDHGYDFSFFGVETEYTVDSELGAGHYRLLIAATSRDFLNPEGTHLRNRAAALLSFDQEFDRTLGGWLRIGWQSDRAAVDYNAIYSLGTDIKGRAWGRRDANIGLGLAYLNGGNLEIDRSRVAEIYYRWQATKAFALTPSVQYQQDDYRVEQTSIGWIFSLRAVAEL